MKKNFLLTMLGLIFSTQLLASSIVCGDVNSAYVEMDLSKDFKARYLGHDQLKIYKAQGYNYFIAGRNCGLESWQSSQQFEVLLMFKDKKLREAIDLGPFSIYQAGLNIDADLDTLLSTDLVLSGSDKSELHNKTSEIKAELETGRGAGAVKVIISPVR